MFACNVGKSIWKVSVGTCSWLLDCSVSVSGCGGVSPWLGVVPGFFEDQVTDVRMGGGMVTTPGGLPTPNPNKEARELVGSVKDQEL